MVWNEKASELVGLAQRFYSTVDYSSLPGPWQMLIAGGKKKKATRVVVTTSPSNSPFEVLFLTEDAPRFVVKSVYQLLLSKYHPDHNDGKGDTKKLQELMKAYKEIIKNFDD